MNLFQRNWILLFCFLSWLMCAGQVLPPVKNFSPIQYKAGNQNWDISQSADKLIYVANNNGLLEFNGATWMLYPSPNETIMRSVLVHGQRIYTGCYMEFGYWEKDVFGALNYKSISNTLNVSLLEDEEFWNIIVVGESVLYQSLYRIYIYDISDGSVETIRSDQIITKMYEIRGDVYFHRLSGGLYKIQNGKDILMSDDQIIVENEIVDLYNQNGDLLLLTKKNGFYVLREGVATKHPILNNSLSGFTIYSSIRLQDGNFALGTISNGVLLINEQNGTFVQISQANSLQNNTVLTLMEDAMNNIWAGLDFGMSFINQQSPVQVFNDSRGMLGSVYASAIHKGNLYLGTNQGLYYKQQIVDAPFKLIPGTQGQVWSLDVINDELFCSHHIGTLLIEDGSASPVANIQGVWKIKRLDATRAIQGNYDGLYILEKSQGRWGLKNKIEGFNNSSRSFEVIKNQIFVNHEYRGLFELNVDDHFNNVLEIAIDTAFKGINSSIARYGDDIIYMSKKGVFVYDPEKDEFLRDSLISNIYSEVNYTSGRFIQITNKEEYWIFDRDKLSMVSNENVSKIPRLINIPLHIDFRKEVVEYENIISAGSEATYLIGTNNGYMTIDLDKFRIKPFDVVIDDIKISDGNFHNDENIEVPLNQTGEFHYKLNNVRFDFHVAEYYEYLQTQYQYQLQGIYREWSDWDNKTTVFFENLPYGKYTFRVRARIGDKISENEAKFTFVVLRPWYWSTPFIISYIFLIVILILAIHNAYRRHYHRKQGLLIEKNQKELEYERLKNEKEIIKLKNEQLKKNFKEKSNELAASAMSIVRKNELLTEIKNKLEDVKDKSAINPVLKIINRNLNHDENWELFREAFDNADSEFFKKLKSLHSELSPNDLKLCAYLRLNLSTKEIAPLFNISARSVEIKRYRLRKKLGLDSNENLTNYIMRI